MSTIIVGGTPRRLTWKRQNTDVRDLDLELHGVHLLKTIHLPEASSVRHLAAPAIRDQGSIGSCSANAGAALKAFLYMILNKTSADPLFSRLFGYYATRVLEGTRPSDDSGCNIRDVFKSARKDGICLETTWLYDIEKFADKPPEAAYQEALKHKDLSFYACSSLEAIKQSIADGYALMLGFDCFESLEDESTATTGIIAMPQHDEASIGGHAIYIDGYDDKRDVLLGQNSWGDAWGAEDPVLKRRGYLELPQDYVRSGLVSDATTLRAESDLPPG